MEGANARGVVYVAKNSVMSKERIVESCEWVWGGCDTKGKEPAGAPGIPMSEGPYTRKPRVIPILCHVPSKRVNGR